MLALEFDGSWCFELVSMTPPGVRGYVLEEYSDRLLGDLFRGYFRFRPRSSMHPARGRWLMALPKAGGIALAEALSKIANSERGRITVHSRRLVFEWSSQMAGKGLSPEESDRVLDTAQQQLEKAIATTLANLRLSSS